MQLSLGFASDLNAALKEAIAGIHEIEATSTDTHQVAKHKENLWRELSDSVTPRFTRLADLWTTPYFGGTTGWLRFQTLTDHPDEARRERDGYGDVLDALRPFHFELQFPDVFFREDGSPKADPGFDAVVGNPPWERVKLAENEFFAARSAVIARATRASDRKALIAALPETDPVLWAEWQTARRQSECLAAFLQKSGFYPRMGLGDTNLYAVFVERATTIAARGGRVALLVPSGIATDQTTSGFFRHIVENGRLTELLDFENRAGVFADVHRSFKFSIVVFAGAGDPQTEARCGFFLHRIEDADDPARVFALTPSDFATFNPNTLTCPIFRSRADADLTRKIYASAPILIQRRDTSTADAPLPTVVPSLPPPVINPWGVRFLRMFDMTNDSHRFKTLAELDADGYWVGPGHVQTKGKSRYLPLYEGKMVQMYDHRAASVKVNPANPFRAAQEDPTTGAQHADPDFSPLPQYYVPEDEVLVATSRVPPALSTAYALKSGEAVKMALALWLAGWKFQEGDTETATRLFNFATATSTPLTKMVLREKVREWAIGFPWSDANQAIGGEMLDRALETSKDGDDAEADLLLDFARKLLHENKPPYLMGFKDVTSPTNQRTFITSALPVRGAGHNFPIYSVAGKWQHLAPCLMANFAALPLDFVARQKIGGQHLTYFYIEQFPIIPPEKYLETLPDGDGATYADFVRARVLPLVYTARDMEPFARALGFDGPPFGWDAEARLRARCELDALYFTLYGLNADETEAILNTFPIVRRQDEARYQGKFRTRDLILNYRKAYAAGNWDAVVAG